MPARTRFQTFEATVACAAAAFVALAAPSVRANGLYLQAGGGASFTPNALATATIPNNNPTIVGVDLEFDLGFQGQVGIGYAIDDFRVAFETSYSSTSVSEIASDNSSMSATAVEFDADADLDAATFSVNGYWDLPLFVDIRPYLGAGIGYSLIERDDIVVSDSTGAALLNLTDTEADDVVSFQVIAGVVMPIDNDIAIGAEYRYVGSEDIEIRDMSGNSANIERGSHQFSVVLRYHFGTFGGRLASVVETEKSPPGSDTTAIQRERTAQTAQAGSSAQPPPSGPQPSDPPSISSGTPPPAAPAEPITYGGDRQLPAPQSAERTLAAINAGRARPIDRFGQTLAPPLLPQYSGTHRTGAETVKHPSPPKDYGLLLASFRDRKAATRVWPFVKRTYASLLGKPKMRVKREETPGRGRFHNLYAYGYSAAEAQRLCRILRMSGVVCSVSPA